MNAMALLFTVCRASAGSAARWFGWALAWSMLASHAFAITYSSNQILYSWVDPSTHTKVGYNTSPYKFNQLSNCPTASTPPILDDVLSDQIPIGFNFKFGTTQFTGVRIMTNGRIQLTNSSIDNTTCGFGSAVPQLSFPDATLNNTLRIFGDDLDATSSSEKSGYSTSCASRSSCYISYASLGSSPNRTFVVSWNNIPEWLSTNSTNGSYTMQIILKENGDFIYQYNSASAGTNGKNAEIGWQISTSDYYTTKANSNSGFPGTSYALRFYANNLVGDYRMEQSSWNGSSGEVLDSSGFGHNGVALGSAATTTSGKLCRGANIPSNSNTSKIDAIDTGISVPNDLSNIGTITFWYNGNSSWNAGSTRDAQLFDATTTSGRYFYLVRRSSGTLRFNLTDSSGTSYSIETASLTVGANTWKHIAVTWNLNFANPNDSMKIYVDGTLSKSFTFVSTGYLSSSIGTMYIGDNRSTNSDGDGIGTGRSADGIIDEFRLYNYDGGSTLVSSDYNRTSGCLSHYAISNSGTGTTCAISNVTVKPHDPSHNAIAASTTITLSTSPTGGTWTLVSGTGTFTPGAANSGSATYTFNNESQAVFGLSYGTATTVTTSVTDGSFTQTENQALVISSCGYPGNLNACELTSPRCVPSGSNNNYARLNTKLAGTAFVLDLVKLKTDGTLDTGFSNSVTVDLLANTSVASIGSDNCPTGTSTATIALGTVAFTNGYGPSSGVSVGATAFSAVSPGYSAYRDVRVRFTCSAGACGNALTVCSTDNFAVRPTGFSVSSNMTNATTSGTPKLNAGAVFTLTATAVPGYNGSPVINNASAGSGGDKVYTHVGTSDLNGSKLSDGSGVAPISMGTASVATGVVSNANLGYDDVGNFGLLADGMSDTTFTSVDGSTDCIANSSSNVLSGGKYGCNIGNQSNTALFGRFAADHYAVNGSLNAACNGFTYMGQDGFGVAFGATAYSANGVVLAHYNETYARKVGIGLDGYDTALATTVSPLSSRLSPTFMSLLWSGGRAGSYFSTNGSAYALGATSITVTGNGSLAAGEVISFAGDNNTYTVSTGVNGAGTLVLSSGLVTALPSGAKAIHKVYRFSRATSTEGPYDNFVLNSTISDADGALITQSNGVTITGSATNRINASTKLRYGRMNITNAYGSELLDLPVAVRAQYWSGNTNGWLTNTLDSCTALTRSHFTLSGFSGGITSSNMSSNSNIPASSGNLSGGVGTIRLVKPGQSPAITAKGSFYLNASYLNTLLENYLPGAGRETMGVFKSGPTLYIREVY